MRNNVTCNVGSYQRFSDLIRQGYQSQILPNVYLMQLNLRSSYELCTVIWHLCCTLGIYYYSIS